MSGAGRNFADSWRIAGSEFSPQALLQSPHPSLALTGNKTKHFVVCFLLTQKLILSMLVAEKSNVLSPHLTLRSNLQPGSRT